jgi:hypothetical protein
MLSLRKLSISYSDQVWLKLSEELQQKAWQNSQRHSNATAKCCAYLNYLCLHTLIPWLKGWLEEEFAKDTNIKLPIKINILPEESLASIWEVVNGTAINLGKKRLVIIPSETSETNDLEEFGVPQEWIDLPSWQADYYLAIQVNTDISSEGWMRVYGYISHQQLKKQGIYDRSDRCYYISQEELGKDLIGILSTLELVSKEKLQVELIPALSSERVDRLLDIVGNPSVYYPRLAIPFEEWASLLADDRNRQRLYQKRRGLATVSLASVRATNLRQWLQKVADLVEESWQTVETILTPLDLAPIPVRGAREREEKTTKETIASVIRLLQPEYPEKERAQAAGVLGKIGTGHPEAIAALTELLQTANDEETLWEAALSLGKLDPSNPLAGSKKGKLIDLGMQLGDCQLALIISIMPRANDKIGVWLQLQPSGDLTKLPAHLKLSVLSEGKTRLEAEARSDNDSKGKDKCIQLRFTPPSGTSFQVRVTLNEMSFTEDFVA